MAKNANTFEKRRKEMEKKRKADEKRARKRAKKSGIPYVDPDAPPSSVQSATAPVQDASVSSDPDAPATAPEQEAPA
jgi:TRAP-type C4-dicarboxylate transport system substrate-binding protein